MASPAVIAKNTSGGTYQWTAPAGVSTVDAQAIGGGGAGGGATSTTGTTGGGGGGGEDAEEPSLAVTAGSSYTFVIGAGATGVLANTGNTGGSTTIAGDAVTVTAHGGTGGTENLPGTGGAGGTGSSNTTHHNGGAGASGVTNTAGGGGGSSGGTSSAGNAGSGGTGGTAVTGGGPGGTGASSAGDGSVPSSGPGGGGGGAHGGGASRTGGAGFDGQITLTWTGNVTSTGSLALAALAESGTVSVANPVTSTGSLALSPLAMSGGGNNGVIASTGSLALSPLHMSGSALAGNIATGSLALSPLAMQSTDIEVYNATGGLALSPLGMSGSVYQAFPFPGGVLNLLFELNVGGTWTDITGYVYQRQTTTITRGRPDESSAGSQAPATCVFTLNNRNGQFSPKNPMGPYYGLIGKNTQFRVSAQSDVLTDLLTYRFWGEISEWPPTWDQTGNDIAVAITASGILRRLNQNAALNSALFRYYQTLTGTAMPLAWWPGEDGAQATSLASGLPRGFPMTFTGNPTLASDNGLASSAAFPSFNGATFNGPTGVAGALPVSTTVVLSSSGTWQAPAGITSVLVQAWGAGGGGSGFNGSTGGAGGGGGEYAAGSLNVTPGSSYSFTVGTSAAGGNGGSTVMHGDSSSSITAHGGSAGSSDGSTGGAGGTGSAATTHFDGGAGAAGSGGPGGGGSETQNSQTFTSSGTWSCPSDYVSGSLQAYIWGAGGGGGGGGSSTGGGGGGGGGFSSVSPSVSASNNYSVTVGSGGSGGSVGGDGQAGGSSKFNGGSTATGGQQGHANGNAGPASGGTTSSGGNGGNGTSGNKGGGGGGGPSIGGSGSSGQSSASGGGGGSGASSGGSGIPAGGNGGDGGTSTAGNRTGNSGGAPSAAGGGGYTNQFSTGGSGGNGARGEVQLYWYESSAAPAAAVAGGGGSSGGSASAGNAGDTEAGGAAVTGGGPGGGTLAGSTFTAAPASGPGGGGGGYDSLGNAAAGYSGLITLTYAPGGSGTPGTAANVLRFVLHVPSGGDTDGAVVAQMDTTGTVAYIQVIYNQASDGSLTLTGFTGAGASLFTTGEVAFGCDGEYLLVSAELQTSGSNVTYQLTGILAGSYTTAATANGTLTGASLGGPFSVIMDPAGALTSTTFAHTAILETYDPVTDLAGALAAYAGETAATRLARICTEQGIGYEIIDAPGIPDTTALVGPQLPAKLTQLLQDCEDADRGLLYEPRDLFGVAYRTRCSLYNQTAAVQLDYSLAQVAYPMQPTDDDQLLRNDVTITRPSGSSSEFQVLTGALSIQDPPDGVGSYTYAATWNVDTDGQLPSLASWTAYIGTWNDLRYPVINLDLARAEIAGEFAAVVAMDIGDYEQIVNTAPPIPPGDIRQLLFGYSESFGPFGIWTIAGNCVPEMPYETAVAAVAAGDPSKADTDGSQLHAGIGTGDTTFAVDTPAPNMPWVDSTGYPAEFPFDITITGERMTCTGISGTSTPQTFTVLRAVNGVQKAHNAGEAVNLYQPAIAAL